MKLHFNLGLEYFSFKCAHPLFDILSSKKNSPDSAKYYNKMPLALLIMHPHI